MNNSTKFYIDGEWITPAVPKLFDVVNPATEKVAGQISLGSAADVDRAVAAARRAFPSYSETSREDRLVLLKRIVAGYKARNDELARAMTAEMGTPITFSIEVQTVMALAQFEEMISVLASYEFEKFIAGALIHLVVQRIQLIIELVPRGRVVDKLLGVLIVLHHVRLTACCHATAFRIPATSRAGRLPVS